MTINEATTLDLPAAPHDTRLVIDYWTVVMEDQTSCDTCDAALTALTGAVATLRPLAEPLGILIEVVPRAVTTWPEAIEHHIAASPTIRAAGTELRPAHPDSSETRLWSWRGTQHSALPEAALLDFLLRALATRSAQVNDYLHRGGPAPYLRRFLTEPAASPTTTPQQAACGPSASCA